MLPCHSQPEDAADAKLLARKFKIKTKTIDISEVYDGLLDLFPDADRMTKANIRPRLRMTVLYYFARKMNFLVCGTSNKSELCAGYFTKFGDGASDILPIGALLKTQIRALALELKIPQRIIDKPPTAGLWPGQTDELEMGITYPELDDIIDRISHKQKQVQPAPKVLKVRRLMKCSEHKRQKPPVFDIKLKSKIAGGSYG
jgi:NAD+ synthase